MDMDKDFILEGIEHGFTIMEEPNKPVTKVHCKNYKSATSDYRTKVEQQIYTEISNGRYVICDEIPTIVSSLGAIPKKSGKARLIHDCSRPYGHGLNSYARKGSFKYETIDKAVSLLPDNGYLAKIDLSNAYRSVPIHPSCYKFTGLHWVFEGDSHPIYFTDTRLPFGASESPEKFQRCTSAVVRMLARRGYTAIVYLDDFLIIESNYERCQEAYTELLSLLQNLGFTINWDKVEAPCQKLTFLGVEIDSVSRTLSLPTDKLSELQTLLNSWLHKKKATKKELQSLVGKLNWAARVERGGRTFLRRLIDVMCTLKRKHHHIRLSSSAQADVTWWATFISQFNGTVQFICDMPEPEAYLTSDACNIGGAAVFNQDWFYANWTLDYPDYSDAHINVKELLAFVLAAKRWANKWRNKHIILYTDNTCTMFMVNKGSSHNCQAMSLLREFFWISTSFNFHVTARHISGCNNVLSDFISRLHEHHYWQNTLQAYYLNCYPLHRHMSEDSILFLQDPKKDNGTSYNRSVLHSKEQPLPQVQNQLTHPCKDHFYVSAYILAEPHCLLQNQQ